MQSQHIGKYFFLVLLIGAFIFAGVILSPFFTTLILGASFAIVLHPIHTWLRSKVTKGREWIAALLTTLFFIIVLAGPLFGIGVLVFKQSESVYQSITNSSSAGPFLDTIGRSVESVLPPGFEFDIHDKLAELVTFVSSNVATFFSATLSTIFGFLLMILAIFYFLKDGSEWKKSLVKLSPLPNMADNKIFEKIKAAVNGVIKGYLLIAVAQGILSGVGMAIFNVPNPALFGVLAGIASLIPSIGTAIVAVPVILFLLATGETANAIGFGIWAAALVGMVDNLLNPYIVGSKLKVPPLLILFAVLGGISLLGPVGILIGPLAMSFLYVLVSIYRTGFEKEEETI